MEKSVHDKVGQMLMAGFEGTTAPKYFLDWLHEGRLGGVILFSRNVESPQQLAALTESLHAAAKYPLLIAIDQEGGTVARLRHTEGFSESPGAMALANIRHHADDQVEAVSGVLGAEMVALGINWTYAPVMDINHNSQNPTLGTRSFGSDPEAVAGLASAAVRGFQNAGVAACAKHFPGLGDTAIDTHMALPRLDTAVEQLHAIDLLPYRAALESDLATIMTTHTIYTTLDAEHPATLSGVIIKKLLREELNFQGVVTTDCMEMKAIDDHYGVADSVVRAANAGVDIVLFSHTADKQAEAFDHLLAAVESGKVSMDLVDAANARIEALKARFALGAPQLDKVHSAEHQATMLDAARATVVALRQEAGVLPLSADDGRRVVLIEFGMQADSPAQDADYETALTGLLKKHLPNLHTLRLPAHPTTGDLDRAMRLPADVLVIASRSAHLRPPQIQALQKLAEHGAALVLLALRNPFDAGLIEGGSVFCTCGDSHPSLVAVCEALMGQFSPSASLAIPISL